MYFIWYLNDIQYMHTNFDPCPSSAYVFLCGWLYISCYSCRFAYVLCANVTYIYPVSCLVEIKLFPNCFKLLKIASKLFQIVSNTYIHVLKYMHTCAQIHANFLIHIDIFKRIVTLLIKMITSFQLIWYQYKNNL